MQRAESGVGILDDFLKLLKSTWSDALPLCRPLPRDGERTLHEIRTLEEGRRVVGDAVVEVCALEGRDVVIITNSGVGRLREKRNLAGRVRGWGRRTWLVLELGVEAPDL